MSILDPTVGGGAANSYVSDEEFQAYLVDRPNAPAAVNLDLRRIALLGAARDLETLIIWDAAKVGPPTSFSQALRFPAIGVWKRDGLSFYENDVVPDFIKYAQMEQAIAYLEEGANPRAEPTDALKSIRVDVIALDFASQSGAVPGQVLCAGATREAGYWIIQTTDAYSDGTTPLVLV